MSKSHYIIPIPADVLKDVESGKYRDYFLIVNRKSTDEPNSQKNSIKYQKSTNLRYAEKQTLPVAPLTIEGFCRDGIVSERHSAFKEDFELRFGGDNTVQFRIERPKFFLLIQWLSKGYFKGAIHLCWDRASRNKADDAIIRKVEKSGAKMLFSLAEYDKTSSGELHMDVDGVFAAHHSRVTSEKVRLAVEENRNDGIWTHKAGVGYLNEGTMEHKPHDPFRAPIILQAAKNVADEGWSLSRVNEWSISQGFTMPPMRRRRSNEEMLEEEEEDDEGNDKESKIPKTTRLTTPVSWHKILTNRFYTGKVLTKDGRWIPSKSHTAIIPEDLFERVQARLNSKRQSVHYKDVLDHPCRGMFRCGDENCARVYTPYEQKGITYFGSRCVEGCSNPRKSFNLKFITDEVGKKMEKLVYTQDELDELDARTSTEIALLETKRLNQMETIDRQKKVIRESLAYLSTHRLDLLKARAYTPEQIVAKEDQLNRELKDLQSKEQTSDEAMRETVKDVTKLSELLKQGSIYYSLAHPREKDRIIRTIFSELTINGETLQFKCKNGFKTLEKRLAPNCDPMGI